MERRGWTKWGKSRPTCSMSSNAFVGETPVIRTFGSRSTTPRRTPGPWTVSEEVRLLVDTEPVEFICNENSLFVPASGRPSIESRHAVAHSRVASTVRFLEVNERVLPWLIRC